VRRATGRWAGNDSKALQQRFPPGKCLSGGRKALRVALADNPFVKGEGLSPTTRRELLGHSQMTLGLQLVLTTSRKTIFSPI
jgi:hypothetical protein